MALFGTNGVRADFEDDWVIVRASGTENHMRIFAEGNARAGADSLLREFVGVVKGAVAWCFLQMNGWWR